MQRKNTSRRLRVILPLLAVFSIFAVYLISREVRSDAADKATAARLQREVKSSGVCPPFKLRDEKGGVIDPVHGLNTDVPYSPKQTCGASGCHDYEKITRGFHFTQGKGEAMPKEFSDRFQWVTSPGVYGGNWCSPAPLYRQLAPKKNANARTIDMTSFDFVTATCGNCHPGGGPMEYDRDGKRYDTRMLNKNSRMVSGGDNNLDGDYYKARWGETGVIEADCLLCHMPEYDYKKRNGQLKNLNFKWAATAGAGLGNVDGNVSDGAAPRVIYNMDRFDEEGNVIAHIVPEPRNETCLNCHAKPGWKKRGASFSARTDVHIAAGLRCVDCHAAGSRAVDSRINGKEEHQFGKGDDPSGWIRNDLDDTVRSCEDCHIKGWNNAPRATHKNFPPSHLEKLSCQTCHIPNRSVKSALVQASDVFNAAPRITPPPKRIWTFYDQERVFWNHYGELELFTNHDQPTDMFLPTLAWYKGKIYPVNRVHSTWVGFEEKEKPGLNQLFMKDFFTMWKSHVESGGSKYPQLAAIKDDDGDGHFEVNRPEEIDALLASVKQYLEEIGFPLEGKRLVWVNDSRAYYSSGESKELPRKDYEATAYASVYKYSHDVAPAKAALGSGGCTDCHSKNSKFFDRPVLVNAFSGDGGTPEWMPNRVLLNVSERAVAFAAFREQRLKPMLLWALLALPLVLLLHYIVFGPRLGASAAGIEDSAHFSVFERVVHYAALTAFFILAGTGIASLMGFGLTTEHLKISSAIHYIAGCVFVVANILMLIKWCREAWLRKSDWQWLKKFGGYLGGDAPHPETRFNAGQKVLFWLIILMMAALAATGFIFSGSGSTSSREILFTIHAVLGVLLLLFIIAHLYLATAANPGAWSRMFTKKRR